MIVRNKDGSFGELVGTEIVILTNNFDLTFTVREALAGEAIAVKHESPIHFGRTLVDSDNEVIIMPRALYDKLNRKDG